MSETTRRGFIGMLAALALAPAAVVAGVRRRYHLIFGRAWNIRAADVLGVAGEKFAKGAPLVWGEDGRLYEAKLHNVRLAGFWRGTGKPRAASEAMRSAEIGRWHEKGEIDRTQYS